MRSKAAKGRPLREPIRLTERTKRSSTSVYIVGYNPARLFCAGGTAASAVPVVRRSLPLVTAGAALPPHFFVRTRSDLLRRFHVLFIIPFLQQVRTPLCDAPQSFRTLCTIRTIMSSSAPITDRRFPFMPLLTAPPDVFSASRGHVQRRQCSVFLRMPLCGDGRIIGLQTILRTWAVSGTIRAVIAANRPLGDRSLPFMPFPTAPPDFPCRSCRYLIRCQRCIFPAVPLRHQLRVCCR